MCGQQHSTIQKSILKITLVSLALAIVSNVAFGIWGFIDKSRSVSVPEELTNVPTISESAAQSEVEGPTADWKTYRNEEYGFEMKYPSEWVVKESNSYIIFRAKEETKCMEQSRCLNPPFVSISVDDNHDGLRIEEFYDGDPGSNYFRSGSTIWHSGMGTSTSDSNQMKITTIIQRKVFIICPVVTFAGGCDFIIPFKAHFFKLSTFAGYDKLELLIIKNLKVSSDF